MVEFPNKKQRHQANPILSPDDYQAIGLAITTISGVEGLLGVAIIVSDLGVGYVPNETQNRKRHSEVMRKSFRKRADLVLEKLEHLPCNESSKESAKRLLDELIQKRDFLCHAAISKLPNGRLYGEFWERKSFDEGVGRTASTFTTKNLYKITDDANAFIRWICDIFGLNEHAEVIKNRVKYD